MSRSKPKPQPKAPPQPPAKVAPKHKAKPVPPAPIPEPVPPVPEPIPEPLHFRENLENTSAKYEALVVADLAEGLAEPSFAPPPPPKVKAPPEPITLDTKCEHCGLTPRHWMETFGNVGCVHCRAEVERLK